MSDPHSAPDPTRAIAREPRWLALSTVLGVAGLSLALPDAINLGPSWLLPAVMTALVLPTAVTSRLRLGTLNEVLGYTVQSVMTVALGYSVVRLVVALLGGHVAAPALLRAAALVWMTNVLVFAAWYWRLDAGGPNGRDRRRVQGTAHAGGAFLFPQMTDDGARAAGIARRPWHPEFVDYLFLAFNVSTALSPTDAPVLSRWAKSLMMVQATISLATVVLLAARAVNVLPS